MNPPDYLIPYLTAEGSLTALLEAKSGQPLRVQVIKEGYQAIDLYYKKSLNLPSHRPALAWVREVLLFGSSEAAWVCAKSVFPVNSLVGDAKRLRHLKRTPIGYVMFKKNRKLPYDRHIFCYDGRYGRATVYDWQGRKLLIEERFLDAFHQ